MKMDVTNPGWCAVIMDVCYFRARNTERDAEIAELKAALSAREEEAGIAMEEWKRQYKYHENGRRLNWYLNEEAFDLRNELAAARAENERLREFYDAQIALEEASRNHEPNMSFAPLVHEMNRRNRAMAAIRSDGTDTALRSRAVLAAADGRDK